MSSMYVFTPKRGSPICHVLLTVQNTHRRALLFIQNRQFRRIRIFTQTKLSSNYRHKPIVTYWALKKRQALRTIQAKLKLPFFFLLLGCEGSAEIFANVWKEEKNFEVLKRCYIQIYPTSFQQCYGKSVNLLHINKDDQGLLLIN